MTIIWVCCLVVTLFFNQHKIYKLFWTFKNFVQQLYYSQLLRWLVWKVGSLRTIFKIFQFVLNCVLDICAMSNLHIFYFCFILVSLMKFLYVSCSNLIVFRYSVSYSSFLIFIFCQHFEIRSIYSILNKHKRLCFVRF